jgi:hypothetical protein
MSANPKLARSQYPSRNASSPPTATGEAKIEANPEGKIEVESEALA